MVQQLKDIANIQFGLYGKPAPQGDVIYLQGTNFLAYSRHSAFNTFLSQADVSPNHILQKDDILIAAKGSRNTAIKYDGSFGPAVASSLFFIIKPDVSKILPDYLTTFLNDMRTQNLLRTLSGTTTVPHISKKDLAEIIIPIPSMEQQKKIVSIMEQWQQEKKITRQLLRKKELLYSTLFNQIILK